MSLLLIQQKIKLTGQINIGRSSRPEVFCEKDVLRNFSKFRTPLVAASVLDYTNSGAFEIRGLYLHMGFM